MQDPRPKTTAPNFVWNVRTISFFGVASLAAVVVVVLSPGLIGLTTFFLVLYGLQAAVALLKGVVIEGGQIHFPRAISRRFPYFVLGRMHRPVVELEEITYIGKASGAEWVILRFGDDRDPAPFASRERRRAFFDAVRAIKPSVKIYRAN